MKGVAANCAKRDTRANVSQETRVASGAAAANCAKQDTRANASQKARVISGTTAAAINHAARNTRVSVSQETRVVKPSGVQPVHPLPQHQVVVGFSPPP